MAAAQMSLWALFTLIAIAFMFDMMNGLHDAANSIATVVSTNVMSPRIAVLWAAFFNFIAFLVFGLNVAQTLGTGIVPEQLMDPQILVGALFGAIAWDAITWWGGIPSSSSHALVGVLVGAGFAKGGLGAVVWSGVLKTALAIIFSPLVGFVLALIMIAAASWALARRNPFRVDRGFRILQLGTAALYSLGHGGNDAQKTMGIIAALLFTQGYLDGSFHVPFWVVISCHAAMAVGTLIGGWRIVRTMGSRITSIRPTQGACAELGGAITIFMAIGLGTPISTTHTIAGAIAGVGVARRTSSVRWGVASRIVFAWVLTLPVCAIMGTLIYALATMF
jgi:PiT family inorganic phosphate transporter